MWVCVCVGGGGGVTLKEGVVNGVGGWVDG